MTASNGADSGPCDNAAMDVTMKDIAEELGISIGTVSKVLRDHPDISPETRERVRKRMKELNYRPNLTARALVTGRTHSIGFIVPDLVHPFFGEVGRGLSRVLRTKGYNLIISSSEEDQELERRGIEQLLARRVDALILASSEKDADTLRHLEKQRTPYILIDRRPAGQEQLHRRRRRGNRHPRHAAPHRDRMPAHRTHFGSRHQHSVGPPERLPACLR